MYNCVSGPENPVKWSMLEQVGKTHLVRNPYSNVLWYPGGSFKSSSTYNDVCAFALHVVPAYILDGVARVSGKKPT